MVSDDVRAVLQCLHCPALILSQSRTIIAVNDGFCRLTGNSPHDSLVGQKIDDLGFELVSGGQQDEENHDWKSLIDASASLQQTGLTSDGKQPESDATKSDDVNVENFWDDEDERVSSSTGIVLRRTPSLKAGSDDEAGEIRARITIRPLPIEDESMHIATFQRPCSTRRLSSAHSGDSDFKSGEDDLVPNDDSNLEAENWGDREVEVHETVSTAIPYFTGLLDMKGHVVHMSKSWYRVTSKEPLGTGWYDAIHPDDVDTIKNAWTQAIEQREDEWTREARYCRKDGTYHWLLIRAVPSGDNAANSDKLVFWYVSMMDVDKLLRTRQESENRRKSIMTLVGRTDICLWGFKKDHSVLLREGSLQWNPTTALDQHSRRSSSDRSQDSSPEDSTSVARVSEAINDILNGEVATQTLEHKDADRWYRSTLIAGLQDHQPHPKSSQATQAVLGLTVDITDVRARTELELQNQSLVVKERAARDASELKSRFVANMSHELRTPVAGIIGMNDLLMESLTTKKQQYFSKNIHQSAAQLLRLINDVLDLSKIEEGRLEIETVPFLVCKVVENVHNILTIQAQRKQLRFVCGNLDREQTVVVMGDPNRLQQVLLNLLSNSIKFTQTGSVTLTVVQVRPKVTSGKPGSRPASAGEESSRSTSSLPILGQDVELEFVVEDTGCGMTKATIERSFEAFSQADSSTARQYGGTGLGLTISRQLVEMMGGTIHFSSTLSVGTRATVKIAFNRASTAAEIVDLSITDKSTFLTEAHEPVADIDLGSLSLETDATTQPSEVVTRSNTTLKSESAQSQPAKILVLIVEDNAVNLRIATIMTGKMGLQVISASNGKEALDILETRGRAGQPAPNIILMDCMMPIMDGYEATKVIRSDKTRFPAGWNSTPIVALTASAHKGDRERCLEAGMDDYLLKPVNKKKLEQAFTKWTSEGQQRQRWHEETQDDTTAMSPTNDNH